VLAKKCVGLSRNKWAQVSDEENGISAAAGKIWRIKLIAIGATRRHRSQSNPVASQRDLDQSEELATFDSILVGWRVKLSRRIRTSPELTARCICFRHC
jgi:hypothetical protein